MKILMAQEWGIIGLILGNILAYTIFAVIPMIVVVPRIIKRLLADEAQYTA
jgi:hypothetical protein